MFLDCLLSLPVGVYYFSPRNHCTPARPQPEPTDKQKVAIESAAQGVLDARAAHPGASLADLYDPLSMPPDLVKAHKKLDSAVDAAYGYKGGNSDAPRVAFLFELYQKLTSLLPALKIKTKNNQK
jgi:hypothetical protein